MANQKACAGTELAMVALAGLGADTAGEKFLLDDIAGVPPLDLDAAVELSQEHGVVGHLLFIIKPNNGASPEISPRYRQL